MLLISIPLLLTMAIFAYKRHILDIKGSIAAFFIGLLTFELGGIVTFLALLIFLVFGSLATKYKYREKAKIGIAEDRRGTRSWGNVFGNGLAAVLFLIGEYLTQQDFFWVATFSAIATANADTLASELGKIFGKRPRLITNFKEVLPGTNGAISLQGEFFALVGAFVIGLIAMLKMSYKWEIFFSTVIGGFVGCNVDSIIGATIENKGWFNNDLTNFTATFIGALVGIGVFILLR